MTALSRYHEACKLASDCEGLDKYRESISRDMDDIKPATGLFRWLFSSGTRKQRAEDAYQSLTETIQGEYGLQLGKLLMAEAIDGQMLVPEYTDDYLEEVKKIVWR